MTYWLDSNVFVQAHKTAFPMENSPEFWRFLARYVEQGDFRSPQEVYDEIVPFGGQVAKWVRPRAGLRVSSASEKVQEAYQEIADYVQNEPRFLTHHKHEFYRVADGWVVAHAKVLGGTVVSGETERTISQKVKIPTLCKKFDVRQITIWELIREFNFRASDYGREDD